MNYAKDTGGEMAKSAGNITTSVDRISKELTVTSEAITELLKRLDYILKPENSSAARLEGEAAKSSKSELAVILDSLYGRALENRLLVENIINRLDY